MGVNSETHQNQSAQSQCRASRAKDPGISIVTEWLWKSSARPRVLDLGGVRDMQRRHIEFLRTREGQEDDGGGTSLN